MVFQKRDAFTLIELSIVLIIIGLLVGGVLAGRELIRAAEINAQVQQIKNFNLAVSTFELKYGDIPGDANGSSLGFSANNGDGNGLVEGTFVTSGSEVTQVFDDLEGAGLVKIESYANHTYTYPLSLIDDQMIALHAAGRENFWVVGKTTSGNRMNDETEAMDAATVYLLDSKIDDGMPNAGVMRVAEADSMPIQGGGGATLADFDTMRGTPDTDCAADAAVDTPYEIAGTDKDCPFIIKTGSY